MAFGVLHEVLTVCASIHCVHRYCISYGYLQALPDALAVAICITELVAYVLTISAQYFLTMMPPIAVLTITNVCARDPYTTHSRMKVM